VAGLIPLLSTRPPTIALRSRLVHQVKPAKPTQVNTPKQMGEAPPFSASLVGSMTKVQAHRCPELDRFSHGCLVSLERNRALTPRGMGPLRNTLRFGNESGLVSTASPFPGGKLPIFRLTNRLKRNPAKRDRLSINEEPLCAASVSDDSDSTCLISTPYRTSFLGTS
jgi:hypothetical protein